MDESENDERERKSSLKQAKVRILCQELWAISSLRRAGSKLTKDDLHEIIDYAKKQSNENLNGILVTLARVYNKLSLRLDKEIVEEILKLPNLDKRIIDEVKKNQD